MVDTFSVLLAAIVASFSITMYIRVELDFKRNVFRVLGHSIATILILASALYFASVLSFDFLLGWFLLSVVFLMINEVIRIYLRQHSMRDILQNHPRLYWLSRGRLRVKPMQPKVSNDETLRDEK